MRTKVLNTIIVILFCLSMVLALKLVVTEPVAANTIVSSTIVFESQAGFTLTDNGDGTYFGVIPCKVNAGFDIYAKEGATAYMDDTAVAISSHDAWPTNPVDTPDWYQYSLRFYEEGGIQKWALRNHPGATEANPWYVSGAIASGVPMSGIMDWDTMYATETGTGVYLPGTGTAMYPGKAASHGGGPSYWDMDWSWGSEAVPLEYLGFDVTLEDLGGAQYIVTFTPNPEPALSNEGGCFIATAVYGTPMAGEIDILRNFRDLYLLTSPVGEAFVELYYNTSPPVADFIAEHSALKQVVRAGLEPVIAISTVVVNTTLAQKMAIVSSMVLVSTLLVLWLRRRTGRESIS